MTEVRYGEGFKLRRSEYLGPPVREIPLNPTESMIGMAASHTATSIYSEEGQPDEFLIGLGDGRVAFFMSMPKAMALEMAEHIRKGAEAMRGPEQEPEVKARRNGR
jgi:hypothetical protein